MSKQTRIQFIAQEAVKIAEYFGEKQIPEYFDFEENPTMGLDDGHSGHTLSNAIRIAKELQKCKI